MSQSTETGGPIPRVVIFSESGPLAGDLGACLSGRFSVERVTSLTGAQRAMRTPSDALLIVPGRRDRVDPECYPLFRQAVAGGCRVLLLGFNQPEFDDDLLEKIVVLPQFPSPAALFEGLSGLPEAKKKKKAEGS
jgi:hypothetical protein